MGKSGKLFKTLFVGVKAFKSPSKEESTKDVTAATYASKKEGKAQSRKGSKEKCMWSLGKSSSRNRDCPVPSSPAPFDMAETNLAHVEDQQRRIGQPAIPLVGTASVHDSKMPAPSADAVITVGNCCSKAVSRKVLTEGWDESKREDWAAAKIQATFRCYLAQRAFRALKALLRLQALARGRMVRRQAAATLRCMQALVRVQAHARGRRVRISDLGQLVQRHLQQTNQQHRRKSTEGWVSSTGTVQELQAKAQSKQEAVMKRQRALVYAFSEQLRRSAPKKSLLVIDCQSDKDHWGWIWLERWTAARPWEHSSSAASERPVRIDAVTKNDEKVKANTDVEKYKGAFKNESFYGSEFPTERTKLKTKIESEKQRSALKSESFSGNDFPAEATKVKNSIETEKQKGALKSESLSGHDFPAEATKVKTNIETEKQKGASKGESLYGCDFPAEATKVKINIEAEKQKGALKNENVSGIDNAMDAKESIRLSPQPPPPPPLPSFRMVTPCATQPIMPCATVSTNAVMPFAAPPVASTVIYPTAPAVAQLPAVATSPGTSVTSDTRQIQMDSPARLSVSNSASSLSVSPVASCSPRQPVSPSTVSSGEHTFPQQQPVSPSTVSSAEQRSPQWQHSIPPPALQIPDPTFEEISNDVLTPEESVPVRNEGSDVPMNEAVGPENELDGMDREPQKVDNENGTLQADEKTGKQSSSVVPVTEASTKRNTATGMKHEQGECTSPSVPNYMANTLSSKAKARSHNSPKQPDSVSPSSKRRHSLSGSEGKSSPVTHRHIFHVRAGSKGQLASLRDGSSENSPRANGDSRRHGK